MNYSKEIEYLKARIAYLEYLQAAQYTPYYVPYPIPQSPIWPPFGPVYTTVTTSHEINT